MSYYYGMDHILKTRSKVKGILGKKGFDARRFHAKLLSLGPVPLNVARKSMVSWAQRRKAQLKSRANKPRPRTRTAKRTHRKTKRSRHRSARLRR